MGLVPVKEYPDLFFDMTFGPFSAASFANSDSLSSQSSSISSSFTQSQHTQSSVQSAGWTANPTSSLSSEVSVAAFNGIYSPSRDTYVDYCHIRAKVISTDNMNRIRLLVVGNGQSVVTAWKNRQFISQRFNLGDDTSPSSSSAGDSSQQPFVANVAKELRILPNFNRIPAKGLLVIVAEEQPDALVDLVLTIAARTRRL